MDMIDIYREQNENKRKVIMRKAAHNHGQEEFPRVCAPSPPFLRSKSNGGRGVPSESDALRSRTKKPTE